MGGPGPRGRRRRSHVVVGGRDGGSRIDHSAERIEREILLIRGKKVMLDADLADLYGVPTKALNRAVRRNLSRFPEDFLFVLTSEEAENLRCRTGASRWGGRRYPPLAFTEQGVAMLSSVLHSERAVRVNIEIMRAFVRLRQILGSHAELARRLDELEAKYEGQFAAVFEAIRELMEPTQDEIAKREKIGFGRK